MEYIRANWTRLPVVVAAREGRTWGVFRPGQQSRLDREWGNSSAWVYTAGRLAYWALLPLAGLGFVLLLRRSVLVQPLVGVLVIAALNTALTYGQTRYRGPANLVFVVTAAVAVDHLLERRSARGRRAGQGGGGEVAGGQVGAEGQVLAGLDQEPVGVGQVLLDRRFE